MRDDDDLARQAASQHGLLTTSQLRDLGIGKDRQRGLIVRGLLRQAAPGVVAVGCGALTWTQRHAAPMLAAGAPLVASHRSALRIHGIRARWSGVEFSVQYPADREVDGAQIHRVRHLDGQFTVVNGLRVTTPARAIAEVAVFYPPRELQRMLDHAVATGLSTAVEIDLARRSVGRGSARIAALLDRLPDGADETDSMGEISLLRLIVGRGFPVPVRQHPVAVGDARYLIDLSYPDLRLALEYDGRDPHTRHDRFVDDRRRQNDLVSIGWTVMRYTLEELRDRPAVVVSQLRRLLGL